jgi:hypothetical protein
MDTTDHVSQTLTRYRRGDALSARDIAVLRVWLRSWIDDRHRRTIGADRLYAEIDQILTRAGVDWWIERARDVGIDPLPDAVL